MRAFFIPFALAMLLCACAYEQAQFAATSEHNARNSLDYHGLYKPDGPGGAIAEVELSPGGRYRLKDSSGNMISGLYQWDAAGRVVTLLGSGHPEISFFVGENRLWLGTTPHSGRVFVRQGD